MTLRRWATLTAGVGLLVSLYLTIVHYSDGQITLACANAGVINCEEVTSSAESMLGALPVALLGVIWFAASLLLTLVRARRLQLAWSALGLAYVFYLVYAEMFLIGALCLWCTVVHVCVAALFLLAVADATADAPQAAPRAQPAPRGTVAPGMPGDLTRRDGA